MIPILTTAFQLLIAIALVGSVIWILVQERKNHSFAVQIWKRFRLRTWIESLLAIAGVVSLSLVLMDLLPVLKWSWLGQVFGYNGPWDVFLRTSERENKLPLLGPVLMAVLVLPTVPFLAKTEEDVFRRGKERWSDIVLQSVKFGPLHCVMGFSLAVGLVLILAGIFFGHVYRRAYFKNLNSLGPEAAEQEAVLESTAAHSLYNYFAFIGTLIFLGYINFLR